MDLDEIDEYDTVLDDWADDPGDDDTPRKRKGRKQLSEEEIATRAKKARYRNFVRRATSEQELNEVLDWHWEKGASYHVISNGDIDALTYLRLAIKQQPLDYALISTWVMAQEDAEEIAGWLEKGLVKRIDIYLGELSISHYYTITEYLRRTIPKYGGRVCSTKNHSKVMVGYGDKFDFVIESSANVNRNPRYEQTSICIDKGVADFYKGFFDKLSSPHEDYGDWRPWNND